MSNDKVRQTQEPSLEEELEEAKRFFALKEWTQAVDAYAEVLETLRGMHNEEEPLFAPVFHRYGHSLLEYAISKSGALGGGGTSSDGFLPEGKTGNLGSGKGVEKASAQASSSSATASSSKGQEKKAAHDPRFTFGGDAEDSDEEEEAQAQGGGVAKKGEEEEEDDDLGVAFSILEIARVMYEKVLEAGDSAVLKTIEGEEWTSVMVKSQLAEVLNDLADVGLESENFQQASTDYKTSLDLLSPLLQPHSRRLADAYLRLGLALEFHPDATLQSTSGKYVTGACTTLQKRIDSLDARQRVLQKEAETGIVGLAKAEAAASDIRVEKAESESRERLQAEGILPPPSESGERADNYSTTTFEKDDVARMDSEQVEKEKKDVQEMIEELKQKLDDYAASATAGGGGGGGSSNVNASSSGANMSAKEKVQMAINEVLLGSSTNALGAPPPLNPNAPVNDLSAMVKKKKKLPPVEEAVSTKQQHGKRKAEDDVVEVPSQDENSKKQKAK